jgi:hypothetical protein
LLFYSVSGNANSMVKRVGNWKKFQPVRVIFFAIVSCGARHRYLLRTRGEKIMSKIIALCVVIYAFKYLIAMRI